MKPTDADLGFDPRSARPFVIAGPCVIESRELCLHVAQFVADVCRRLGVPYVFKASFDKANRSSGSSFRGPGIDDGLNVLREVRETVGVPVLTDVHESHQVEAVARVVDIVQIPAFLARQTDLLIAAAKTGKWIHVKKGQFMSPAEMAGPVAKIRSAGNDKVILGERGTFFGYNRLVNDMTGLDVMKSLGCPVVFDATHSTQQPGGEGTHSGGNPAWSPLLARAAFATGCVNGLFLECHPDPANAKSDKATVLNLTDVEPIVHSVIKILLAIE